MQEMAKTISMMEGLKIIIVGDLMLDRFVDGDVDRISPESPVPVLNIRKETTMLGGSGNVLANLCALKIKPSIFAVTGDDAPAKEIMDLANAMGADTTGILKDSTRPTTIKTRYLARHQQLLRTDSEKTHALPAEIESALCAQIEKEAGNAKVIVISDYGKGVLSRSFLEKIIAVGKSANIPVLVDPKGRDYTIYRGADIVTPNRKELAEATGLKNLKTDEEIIVASKTLIEKCGIETVVATRSEDGMSVIGKTGAPLHLKTNAREVFDVSGAGDTVIATLAACLAAGVGLPDAAALANIAGGIAVSKVGTAPVRADELMNALEKDNDGAFQSCMMGWDQAQEQMRKWKAQGLKVGLTNGCFDIVHAGHVNYLNQARTHCDRLIVALNHDESVRILKGPTRPVNDENARATVIGALGCVDMVVLFGAQKAGEDNTPCNLIALLQPDIYFKGGDYKIDQLPESKIVHGYGGEVAIMAMHEGFSTTSIIERSRKTA